MATNGTLMVLAKHKFGDLNAVYHTRALLQRLFSVETVQCHNIILHIFNDVLNAKM